jgi:hypothetical protein
MVVLAAVEMDTIKKVEVEEVGTAGVGVMTRTEAVEQVLIYLD